MCIQRFRCRSASMSRRRIILFFLSPPLPLSRSVSQFLRLVTSTVLNHINNVQYEQTREE